MIRSLLRFLHPAEIASPTALPEGVSLRRGRWIPWIGGKLSRLAGPALAVTLGRTIVVHPDTALSGRLLRHELAHVRQWQRHRALFPVLYVWYHFRYGYYDNPFEVEARDAE